MENKRDVLGGDVKSEMEMVTITSRQVGTRDAPGTGTSQKKTAQLGSRARPTLT